MEKVPFIGQLNRKITVFEMASVPNELSEHKQVRNNVRSLWAMMRDTGGSQEIEGRVESVVNRSYTVRWRKEIAEGGLTMFVDDNGRTFAIHAVKEIGRTHLELMVRDHE